MSSPQESQSDGEMSLAQLYEKRVGQPLPKAPDAAKMPAAEEDAADEEVCEYCKGKDKACPMCDPSKKAKAPALFSNFPMYAGPAHLDGPDMPLDDVEDSALDDAPVTADSYIAMPVKAEPESEESEESGITGVDDEYLFGLRDYESEPEEDEWPNVFGTHRGRDRAGGKWTLKQQLKHHADAMAQVWAYLSEQNFPGRLDHLMECVYTPTSLTCGRGLPCLAAGGGGASGWPRKGRPVRRGSVFSGTPSGIFCAPGVLPAVL